MGNLLSQAVQQAISLYDQKVGEGDITTENIFPYPQYTQVDVVSINKITSIGIPIFEALIEYEDGTVKFRSDLKNGDISMPGNTAFNLEGNGQAIMTVWQVAHPILCLLEDVHAKVNQIVSQIHPIKIDVTHTFNLPTGYDKLIAYAVEQGGGISLGTGLDDLVYITTDHEVWAGSINKAVVRTLEEVGEQRKLIKVIVEIDTPEQVETIKDMNYNFVHCSRFNVDQVHQVGEITKGWTKLIVDETISIEEVKELRDAGVRLYALDLRNHLKTNEYFSLTFNSKE